ncbi:MAG: hypothetical protein ABSH56_09230 [Bryobacteraceae bacterium]|jgi:hypothetical protein
MLLKRVLEAPKPCVVKDTNNADLSNLELEQGRYEAKIAGRRYEAVDPDNRLVAAELEVRWNAALRRVDNRLLDFDFVSPTLPGPDKELLLNLAQDLPTVWNAPTADMRLKQRIVRILIEEIVADVDEEKHKIVLLIHWAGGRYSELHIQKNGLGKHQRCTGVDVIEVVRQMSGKFPRRADRSHPEPSWFANGSRQRSEYTAGIRSAPLSRSAKQQG